MAPSAHAVLAAVSLHDDYVAAAYLVLFALVLVYVAIMASKLGRLERELSQLSELADRRPPQRGGETEADATRGSEPLAAGGSAP